MNDNELSSMVRESVAGIRSSTPVDQIISRGHAVRVAAASSGRAGALVVAGAAALGVTALAARRSSGACGRRAGGRPIPPSSRLTAWTVAKQPSGEIDVTISQLQHPAQLQSHAAGRRTARPRELLRIILCSARRASPTRRAGARCEPSPGSTATTSSSTRSALPSGTGVAIYRRSPARDWTRSPSGTTPDARSNPPVAPVPCTARC